MAENNSTVLWDIPPEKRCGKCKKSKPLSEFGKVRGKYRCYCMSCHKSSILNEDKRQEKKCANCKNVKPIGSFSRCGLRFQPYCTDCSNGYSKERNRKFKETGKNIEINRFDYIERRRWAKLKSKYGLSKDDYYKILSKQNGVCAICKQAEKERDGQRQQLLELSVDHDHKTGKVRGLLCRQCNIGIGRLQERVEILQNAIEYLLHHKDI